MISLLPDDFEDYSEKQSSSDTQIIKEDKLADKSIEQLAVSSEAFFDGLGSEYAYGLVIVVRESGEVDVIHRTFKKQPASRLKTIRKVLDSILSELFKP